jgi:hypothetical protein
VRVHGKRVTKTITVWSRSGLPESAVLDVDTPLDGVLQATIQTAPAGSSLSVLDSSGATVIGPAGVQNATFTVCGQRSVKLSLHSPTPGSFRVTVSAP